MDRDELLYLAGDLKAHLDIAVAADVRFWSAPPAGTVEEQIAAYAQIRARRFDLEERYEAALEAADALSFAA